MGNLTPAKKKIVAVALVAILLVAALTLFSGKGPDDEGDDHPFAGAIVITSDGSADGMISTEGADVFYKVRLQPGDVLKVTLDGDPGTDFDLFIYESKDFSDDHLIAESYEEGSFEELTFVAWEDAYYIINVYSYEGTGDFQLSLEIVGTREIDDGDNSFEQARRVEDSVVLTGSVNPFYNQRNFYAVDLAVNWVIDVWLYVPQKCDFDLLVYDPNGNEIGRSDMAYGDERVRIWAEEEGEHYIVVEAFKGSGTYKLDVIIADGTPTDPNNDDLAHAIDMGNYTTATGTLHMYNDVDDCFAKQFHIGEWIYATLDGPDNADFDLLLFDPSWNILLEYSSFTDGSEETILYPVSESGMYYLIATAWEGSGSYTLTVNKLGQAYHPIALIEAYRSTEESEITFSNYDMITMNIGSTIVVDGGSSIDDGRITYSWDFGDGATSTAQATTHSYSQPGTYQITLQVTDNEYNTDTAFIFVEIQGSSVNKYAVVVGVNLYPNHAGASDLAYCVNDAELWARQLQSEGYEVRMLLDSQATEQNIMEGIAWMASLEDENSHIAFTFSGHGAYDSRMRESFLCTWDIDPNGNGFLMDSELEEAFSGFRSQNMFFFFDACHSGGMDGVVGPNSFVSQTCSVDTWGLDVSRYEHGLWTYWFLAWGIVGQGYTDLVECHQNAFSQVMLDPAGIYRDRETNEITGRMTPEMEFVGTSFYL